MTTTLTIAAVRAWNPAALSEAATGVGRAHDAVDSEVRAAKAAVSRVLSSWSGPAADAAADRMAREATTGFALADALATARTALSTGANDLGGARDALLTTISTIQAAGFTVAADGAVTAPTLPPVMTEPGDPTGAAARRNREQQALNETAGEHAGQIGAALAVAAAADIRTADALSAVQVPQNLEAAVDGYLERLLSSHDLIGSLGSVGAGGVALAMAVKQGVKAFTKGSAYLQFLKSSFAPITDYGTMVRNFAKADEMLDVFSKGAKNGGILRFVIGSRAATMVGKAFLPLTVVTGAVDAVTGGGYDGARGWATRGFGAAGAIGAGALLASSAGLVALGPVGLGIAGAAVLAYGAWSLGNLIWDNREAIGDFFTSVGGHIADGATAAWNATTHAVSEATDWAGEQLGKAGDALADVGKGAMHVLSFGFL